jgi:hypothetical protein
LVYRRALAADFLPADFLEPPPDLLLPDVFEVPFETREAVDRPLPPADFFAILRGADFFATADLRAGADFLPAVFDAAFFAVLPAALLLPLPEDFDRLAGTFAPRSLASESPIAMACLREVTFLPLRPLFSLPSFISCIASFTFLPAPLEYFAIVFVFRIYYVKSKKIIPSLIRY